MLSSQRRMNKIIGFILCLVMIFSVSISAEAESGSWQSDSRGWWYKYRSGGYPANAWLQSNGHWYYFNKDGYMVQSDWVLSDGKWYYMGEDGAMYVNAVTPGGYYVLADGVWTGSLGSTINTSSEGVLKAVSFAENLLALEQYSGRNVTIKYTSIDKINNMLWLADKYKDSRLRESGNYFVMNVEDAKRMIWEVFGIVGIDDEKAMQIKGSDMYYDFINFRGDAGVYEFKAPSYAALEEGTKIRIKGDLYDRSSRSYAGEYTIILESLGAAEGYFGGYCFSKLTAEFK